MMKILISRFSTLAAAVRGFKARTLGLLALACLLVAGPATAQVNYDVSGDTAYVATSPNASGDIVIDSTYLGYPVTFIGSWAFSHCTNLTSVTIPNSVTRIGNSAFYDCTSLTGMIIPNNVTSIGYGVFSGCTSLTSVTIPNSITDIGSWTFEFCTSLTSVIIPNSVTNIGWHVFSGCTSLTNLSVDAAHADFSSFNGVLFNKAQTTLIIFPPGRGGSYVIPDSVTAIGTLAFYNCASLTNVIIDSSVTSIGPQAFRNCISMTSVTIPNSVTSIGMSAFEFCTSLTSVTIPNNVTNIESQAFYACTNLTNFTFLGNAPRLAYVFSKVGLGASVYYYCGTSGWVSSYGSLPTVMLCPPGIAPGGAGVKPGGFSFTLTSLTNQTIVVEASTNLTNWQPIWTNTLPGASADFVDPEWLNHSNRYYRARPE